MTGGYLFSFEPEPPITMLNLAAVGVLRDGRVMVGSACCRPTKKLEFVDQSMTLTLMDRAGRVDTLGVFPFRQLGMFLDGSEGARRYLEVPLFGHQAAVEPTPAGFAYGPGDRPEVQFWTLDAGLERIVRWSPEPPAVTPEDVQAYIEWRYGGTPRSIFAQAAVGPDRPVADTFPAYSTIRVSASGDLWVLLHPRLTEIDRPRTWLVFDPDGRFRCRVEVPRLRYQKVGRDYVRGALTDDLGVEYVVEYEIGGPPR